MTISLHADSEEYWRGNAHTGTRNLFRALARYHYERSPCEQTKELWRQFAGMKPRKSRRGRPLANRTVAPRFIRILEAGAMCADVSVEEFNDRKNNRRLRDIRQAVALAVYYETPHSSYLMIASLLGRTDHSTIMHAVKEAKRRCLADPDFAKLVEKLRDN